MKKIMRFEDVLIPIALLFPVLVCIFPALSFGHAFPHHADPKVGSTISDAPSQVRIWFDGDLEPAFSKIVVKDASGKQVDKGDCRVDGSDPKLLQVSCPGLGPGTYKVIWDVVARDGHRTNGDYTFTVK